MNRDATRRVGATRPVLPCVTALHSCFDSLRGFVLPPLQVQYAFLAGLALVLLLIPVNRVLATRIQAASVQMMAAKDRCCFGVVNSCRPAGRQAGSSSACLLRTRF